MVDIYYNTVDSVDLMLKIDGSINQSETWLILTVFSNRQTLLNPLLCLGDDNNVKKTSSSSEHPETLQRQVSSVAETAVDQLQVNEKIIAGN